VDPLVDFKWWLTDEEEEEDINYYNNKRGIQVGNREDGPVLNQNRQSASGTNQTRRRHRQPSLRGGHRNFSAGNRGTSSQDKFNNRLILDDGPSRRLSCAPASLPEVPTLSTSTRASSAECPTRRSFPFVAQVLKMGAGAVPGSR